MPLCENAQGLHPTPQQHTHPSSTRTWPPCGGCRRDCGGPSGGAAQPHGRPLLAVTLQHTATARHQSRGRRSMLRHILTKQAGSTHQCGNPSLSLGPTHHSSLTAAPTFPPTYSPAHPPTHPPAATPGHPAPRCPRSSCSPGTCSCRCTQCPPASTRTGSQSDTTYLIFDIVQHAGRFDKPALLCQSAD